MRLKQPVVKMGGDLHFSIEIESTSDREQSLVVDYIVHHVKANGRLTPKVFKLAQRKLRSGECVELSKRHSFRPISTRKYYAGQHILEIQINGRKYTKADFELK